MTYADELIAEYTQDYRKMQRWVRQSVDAIINNTVEPEISWRFEPEKPGPDPLADKALRKSSGRKNQKGEQ